MPAITFTARTAPAKEWQSVCWSPSLGLFVAVAYGGTNPVMTSPDGVTWTTRTAPAKNWYSVCWSPNLSLFCAVSNTTAGTSDVMTSPDGITWTLRTPSSTGVSWYSVCWSPGLSLFVAVGTSGQAMTSPTGTTWTSHFTGVSHNWLSVCWSPSLSLLVAVEALTSTCVTSPDGITWTSRTLPSGAWVSVCWSPELNLFCATAQSGTNLVATSPNGTTWTARTPVSVNTWYAVAWSPEAGVFCAIGGGGSMISVDGATWIAGNVLDCIGKGLCWSPSRLLFCGVGDLTGTIPAMTGTVLVYDYLWISATPSTWETPASWDATSVPSSISRALFDSDANGNCVLVSPVTVASLTNNSYTGTLSFTNGVSFQCDSFVFKSGRLTLGTDSVLNASDNIDLNGVAAGSTLGFGSLPNLGGVQCGGDFRDNDDISGANNLLASGSRLTMTGVGTITSGRSAATAMGGVDIQSSTTLMTNLFAKKVTVQISGFLTQNGKDISTNAPGADGFVLAPSAGWSGMNGTTITGPGTFSVTGFNGPATAFQEMTGVTTGTTGAATAFATVKAQYYKLTNCDNSGSLTPGVATDCVDGGGNTNWVFPASGTVNKFLIGSTPANWSDDTRWSTSSGGANNTTHPTANDFAILDGGGTGSLTIDVDPVCKGWNSLAGYTGVINFGSTPRTLTIGSGGINWAGGSVVSDAAVSGTCSGDFISSIAARWNGTPPLSVLGNVSISGPSCQAIITCKGASKTISINTSTVAAVVLEFFSGCTYSTSGPVITSGGVVINGVVVGDISLIKAAFSAIYALSSGSSHTGNLTLEQDATIVNNGFLGTARPNIIVQNSASGSTLPNQDYNVNLTIQSTGKVIMSGGTVRPRFKTLTNLGSFTSSNLGLEIDVALISSGASAGGVWTKGTGRISFVGTTTILGNLDSYEAITVETGTLTNIAPAIPLESSGIIVRPGATLNTNGKTFTLADPTDGLFQVQAGGALTVAGLAGTTINCLTGDLNGTSPATKLNLNNTGSACTINATNALTARYATMKNIVAGGVGGTAYDCTDVTPGSCPGWTFVSTATPATSTRYYGLSTASDLTNPAYQTNKVLSPTLTGSPTPLVVTVAPGVNTDIVFWTNPNDPNNADWGAGNLPAKLNIAAANATVSATVGAVRGQANGVVLQSSAFPATQSCATVGTKTFTIIDPTWTVGTNTDRMGYVARFTTTSLVPVTVSIQLNDGEGSTYLDSPITIIDEAAAAVAAASLDTLSQSIQHGVAVAVVYEAFNTITGLPAIGDGAFHTFPTIKDGVELVSTFIPTERSGGQYVLFLSATDTMFGWEKISPASATTGVVCQKLSLSTIMSAAAAGPGITQQEVRNAVAGLAPTVAVVAGSLDAKADIQAVETAKIRDEAI